MKINIHAGHNPDGKVACGAVGLIKESTQARKVRKSLIKYLRNAGHTVYNCTCNNGTSQSDVLNKIVKKCNAHTVDYDISLHFNSGRKDLKGDNNIGGTEVEIYSFANKKLNKIAKSIADSIAAMGYKLRSDNTTKSGYEGVKARPDLYVLNATKAPAMLIECCFVDDADDVQLYSAKKMGQAIAIGILNACGVGINLTTRKLNTFNEQGKKIGSVPKGTVCNVDRYKFINGYLMAHRKKNDNWVRAKYIR